MERFTVSIEPLWNWNEHIQDIDNLVRLYQSNLYGIETMPCWICLPRSVSINRTFMELKRCWHDGSTCRRLGINRTFMELKRYRECPQLVASSVSIEPLWNWNRATNTALLIDDVYQSNLYGIETVSRDMRRRNSPEYQSNLYGIETSYSLGKLNHTSKVSIEPLWNWNDVAPYIVAFTVGINRTFMELKLYLLLPEKVVEVGINRTFMELKPRCARRVRQSLAVSIEPLWNWNGCLKGLLHGEKLYQSNLYGIETQQSWARLRTAHLYQSNLYGIETVVSWE